VLAKNWTWFLENPDRMDDPLLHQRRNVSKWLVEAKATMPSGYLRQAVDEIEGQLGKVIEPTVEPSDQSWCPLAVEPLWSTLTEILCPYKSNTAIKQRLPPWSPTEILNPLWWRRGFIRRWHKATGLNPQTQGSQKLGSTKNGGVCGPLCCFAGGGLDACRL
jgi:hypothetical protein